ncbi:hypothetical protein PHLGIDRAFT_123542 [Phlebiopsis gigantea 11061_1 CR5-6]|uniref:Uncharacterized protein n=1 Tax=Phlebiopsis gigantea (strain 11061_1 CR5-6) TaxID=745531 RepID=A0A0C3S1A7_PHLG1|nr:hypothetical protein PHLGIDRAFT_123542 [Phlebiopsis gigantea 11061_1 CR5-6]
MPSSIAVSVIFDDLHQFGLDGVHRVRTEAPQQRRFLEIVGMGGDAGERIVQERAFLNTLTADLDVIINTLTKVVVRYRRIENTVRLLVAHANGGTFEGFPPVTFRRLVSATRETRLDHLLGHADALVSYLQNHGNFTHDSVRFAYGDNGGRSRNVTQAGNTPDGPNETEDPGNDQNSDGEAPSSGGTFGPGGTHWQDAGNDENGSDGEEDAEGSEGENVIYIGLPAVA